MSQDRLIVTLEIKEGHPSPVAVFGDQVKTESYEIGDLVEADLLNGKIIQAHVKEIFEQNLTSLCMRRFVQVRNGKGVRFDWRSDRIADINTCSKTSIFSCSHRLT